MSVALVVTARADATLARVVTAAHMLADEPAVLLADGLAEPVAALVARLAPGYGAVLAAADAFGTAVLARAAALADAPLVGDVIAIRPPDTFVRALHAETVHATVQLAAPVKFLTVRAAAFAPAAAMPAPLAETPATWTRTHRLRGAATAGGPADLATARAVVGVGRGAATPDLIAFVERLAARLGAAIGASRPAVDAGLVAEASLLGQSGKGVAPDLYLALGISGALQHLAGVKDAKVIAAINAYPAAAIFEAADFGLVEDLRTALPALLAALDER